MSRKVLTYTQHWNPFWSVPDDLLASCRTRFPDISFIKAANREEFLRQLPDTEIFYGYRLGPEELDVAKQLRWIHVAAANVYGFSLDILRERKILLTNSRGLHASVIAQHVIGTMILFSRRLLECRQFQQQRHWAQMELLNQGPPLSELRGKTVYILGLGHIGTEIAKLCKAFGMQVLALKRRFQPNLPFVDALFTPENFRLGLPDADYIVIAMARTKQTEGLLQKAEFQMMKHNTVLINIARASIVDQQALLDALKEGKIRGAALDVFEQEPLPADSEFWLLPNVFITPHVAGVSSREHWPRMFELFEENLRRYLNAQPLLNVVDLQAGY